MASQITPVILSGGSGTRLWPLSRDLMPKQLLPLTEELSLLAATARRASGDGFAAPLIVCNKDHRFLVTEQLAGIGITPRAVLLEPVGRNTAPALAAAALHLAATDPDALMLVLPSDHVIRDVAAFHAAVFIAAKAARTGRLVTFGITPTTPETGYGYIKSGAGIAGQEGARAIERFVEKPDRATAEGYLAEGAWCWNSGMFVFPAGLLIAELEQYEPAIVAAARAALAAAPAEPGAVALAQSEFACSPAISIDYAVMERTDKAAIVPADLGWSDVGSWSALWELGEKDSAGNVTLGDVLAEATSNCYLRSDGPLVATLGLDDIVLVATPDVVMAAPKGRAQEVKTLVGRLKESGRPETVSHKVVHRPWGTYQTVDAGPGFQVKRITVKPGAKLSLQKHARRAEHWVVASGTAIVTRDQEIRGLERDQSVYIPLGAVHRLENPGAVPLELIEVQCGDYLGEDDIVRLSDDYGRS